VHGVIDTRDPDDRSADAGEYVLGTLSVEDRAVIDAALATDATLRTEVYAWQDRLLGLSARAAPATASPQLWNRIDRSIDARAAPRAVPARAQARAPWWQGLRVWQGISAIAVVASLFMATRLLSPSDDSTGGRFVAVLQSPDNRSTGWVVDLHAVRGLRLVPVGDTGPVPPGRALEFWTKPEGAAGPTSLGLVRAGQTIELPVTRLPAVGARQLFEITLEPENGSTIGRPTGPILYLGRTLAL
jgi:anti-sigma-K factor RskA